VALRFPRIPSVHLNCSMRLHISTLSGCISENHRLHSFSRKRIKRIAGLCLLLLVAAGCGQKTRTIALLPRETADDLWEPAHKGAVDAARGSGFRVYWNGPTRPDDFQRQILLLDQSIRRGDEGIVIAPDQSLALMTPVLRAISAGLPTVVLGSQLPMPPAGGLSYVLNDEDEEGRIAAARLCERLHGKGTIAVLGVDPGTPGIVRRLHAFQTAVHSQCRDLTIAEVRMGSEDKNQAEHAAQEVLANQPQLNAIFALTGASTLGAFRALRDGNKSQQVLLVGCDQQYGQLFYLSQGAIDSIIAQNTYEMAGRAIKMIVAERNGQTIAHLALVKPVLLTPDNLYDPQFAPLLTYWRAVP
jgi:ribose transport system substrate-binding protein